MTSVGDGNPDRYVSRLGWESSLFAGEIEVPHVRGIPVDAVIPPGAARTRCWPNRMGILEPGTSDDSVVWKPHLAPRPTEDAEVFTDRSHPTDFVERLSWFRGLLKGLSQHRAITAAARPDALCAILLTPGLQREAIHLADAEFSGAIESTPDRLAEFPGALQLMLTESAWQRREQYAQSLHTLVEKDG